MKKILYFMAGLTLAPIYLAILLITYIEKLGSTLISNYKLYYGKGEKKD